MNFDEYIEDLKKRRPGWFETPPNAQNRPQEPVAVKKAPDVVKLENVPQTPPNHPAPDAVEDGCDGAEVVEAEEETEWWNL